MEKAAVESLAADQNWFTLVRWEFFEGLLSAVGSIRAHDFDFEIRLCYPDQFPHVPAWVQPLKEERLSQHQYGKATLCLELRPDNWESTATGADVLRSAYNLLETENSRGPAEEHGEVPTAHDYRPLQAFDWFCPPLLISAGCAERLKAGAAEGLTSIRWVVPEPRTLVRDAFDQAGDRPSPGQDVLSLRAEVPVHVSNGTVSWLAVVTRKELFDRGFDESGQAKAQEGQGVFILTGGKSLQAFWVSGVDEPQRMDVHVLAEHAGVRSGGRTAAERVSIVGGGSVGSKLAEVLGRSGLRKLVVVDGDVLLPGNLERNALDWRHVGSRKVAGIARRLAEIDPGVSVETVSQNLNWQRSATSAAEQISKVAEADLIVDATGDPATSLFLGAIAADNDKPFVSIEVFEGGIGCLVASCVPGRDAPYSMARANFLAWCQDQGRAAPRPSPRRYEAVDDDGAPFVADDAAVTMAVGHAARVILDILDGKPAHASAAWLLIGFSHEWVFDGHGHVIRLAVGDPVAPTQAASDHEIINFLADLAKAALTDAGQPKS